MAAETQRATCLREREDLPAIEHGKPTINSIIGAVDDISCKAERVQSLFGFVEREIGQIVSDVGTAPAGSGLYPAWLLLVTGVEKLAELSAEVEALASAVSANHAARVRH